MNRLSEEFKEEQLSPVVPEASLPSLLGQYLAEVEEGLYRLPGIEQRAELLELRAHLLAMVQAEQELGSSTDEAVLRALKQFGSAQEVTAEIVRVWEESRRTPLRQLAGALVVSIVGAVIAYFTAESVRWTGTDARGYAMAYFGFSHLVKLLAPIALGTVIGKAFPRALHARIPLVIAALVWPLWDLVRFFPSGWLSQISEAAAWRAAVWDLLMQRTMHPYYIVSFLIQSLTFLLLAWVAQSVARRSLGKKGLVAWGKDLLRRIPDSWIGGMALGSVAGAVAGVVPGFLVTKLQLFLGPVHLMVMAATGAVAGACVGYFLPRRGWVGSLLQTVPLLVITLFMFWQTPTIVGKEFMPIYLISTCIPLITPLAAYGAGRKRLAAN